MYSRCVDAGTCAEPENISSSTHPRYYGNPDFENHPAIYVSWNMAKTYCEWTGRRLPTEAQWEKAARGTDGRTYPWGNNGPSITLLNFGNNVGDTTEVGKYPNGVSPYGALDMAGNVWEWVMDWYHGNYYATLGENASSPQGLANGQYRILRGGSFSPYLVYDLVSFRGDARSADRGRYGPSGSFQDGGFRRAMSATP